MAIPIFQDTMRPGRNEYDPSSDSWSMGAASTLPGWGQALDALEAKLGAGKPEGYGALATSELFKDPNFQREWNQQYPGSLPQINQHFAFKLNEWRNNESAGPGFWQTMGAIGGGVAASYLGAAGALGDAIPASAAGVGVEGGVGAGVGSAAGAGGSAVGAGAGIGSGGGEVVQQQLTNEALGGGLRAGAATGAVGGGELGSGLTAAAPAAGNIGGGSLGTGLTAAGVGAAGLGALGQGSFAGENVNPVIGGASQAAATGLPGQGGGGAGGGTGTGGGGSAVWNRIMDGTATAGDWASIAGSLAPGVLGYMGAGQQADAYKDIANQYMGMGAPYRQRLSDLYSDPSSFLKSQEVQVPVQQGTDAVARALSVNGNPTGNGSALQEMQNYASNQLFGRLGQEKDRLAGFGGLSQYNAAAPAANSNAINAQAGQYNAIGYGLGQALNPMPSLDQYFRNMSGNGGMRLP